MSSIIVCLTVKPLFTNEDHVGDCGCVLFLSNCRIRLNRQQADYLRLLLILIFKLPKFSEGYDLLSTCGKAHRKIFRFFFFVFSFLENWQTICRFWFVLGVVTHGHIRLQKAEATL